MKAHDVRNLRYCRQCAVLGHKDDFLTKDDLCIACAWNAAGGLMHFMELHPDDWKKLPLGLIGPDCMLVLIGMLENRAVDRRDGAPQ